MVNFDSSNLNQGDIVFVDFNPTVGNEQAGKRPGLVVSHNDFNKLTGMCLVCPISNNKKSFPTHVEILNHKITGTIFCEHIKSLDLKNKKFKFVESLDEEILENVLYILRTFI